jgi:hypothetical protein
MASSAEAALRPAGFGGSFRSRASAEEGTPLPACLNRRRILAKSPFDLAAGLARLYDGKGEAIGDPCRSRHIGAGAAFLGVAVEDLRFLDFGQRVELNAFDLLNKLAFALDAFALVDAGIQYLARFVLFSFDALVGSVKLIENQAIGIS